MKTTFPHSPTADVSNLRLAILRATYLFIFTGLAITRWPEILNPPAGVSNADTVVGSVLAAISLLALLGVRYPLKMLPLLFFELLWKAIWVAGWGIPLLLDQRMTADSEQTLVSTLVGVALVPIALPWGYVFSHYATARGDGRRQTAATISEERPAAEAPTTA